MPLKAGDAGWEESSSQGNVLGISSALFEIYGSFEALRHSLSAPSAAGALTVQNCN